MALLSLGDDELKSRVVVERFQFLPTGIQRKVRTGLSNVRIHIFDAKPFALEISDVLYDTTGSPFPLAMLRRLERSREQRVRSDARRLLSLANAYVLDRVTRLFPAERLSAQLESSGLDLFEESDLQSLGIPDALPRRRRRARDLARSGGRLVTLHDVDRALAEGAKASAVLADAQARMEQLPETIGGWPVFPLSRSARLQVVREASKTHVFDEGDARELEAVEEQRARVLDAAFESSGRILGIGGEGTLQMSSKASPQIRAADIAAGFARTVYERGGLVGVMRRFKEVTFNGERATENNLDEVMGRMRFIVMY